MNVEEEVDRLKEEIQRLGTIQPDGSYKVRSSHLPIHFLDLSSSHLPSKHVDDDEISPDFRSVSAIHAF